MGDEPNNTFHLPSATSQNQPLLQELPFPYFSSHPPPIFVSDPELNFLSLSSSSSPPLPLFHSLSDSFVHPNDSGENEDFNLNEDNGGFVTDHFHRPSHDTTLSLGLALGLGPFHNHDADMDHWDAFPNCPTLGVDVHTNTDGIDLELGLGLVFGGRASKPSPSCVEVVDIDSDSDSDQDAIFESRAGVNFDEIDRMPLPWDNLGLNQHPLDGEEESENEEEDDEVYNHDWELGESGMVVDHSEELFNWYNGRGDRGHDIVSIHSDLEDDREIEEAFLDMEWEILFAGNNLNREVDEDDEDDVYGAVEESMNEWRGNPPAAKSAIEALPIVHLSHDELKENEVTCTVCWSAICEKELVTQLPCRHYYHGECIVPWLSLRNTCPVCRYELPTDDPEYEFEKREMDEENGGWGTSHDLPISSEHFHEFL